MKTESQINWDEVRSRIDSISRAIEQGFALSPEEDREVLRSRARDLGKETQAAAQESETLETVEFELASERYAIPLVQVLAVSVVKDLTVVPCTPAFVVGIINLHGEIRTVIDLKKFFELPEKGINGLNQIILLRHEEMRLGILTDAIIGVRRIHLGGLQRSMPTLTGHRAEYLHGVTKDRLVVLDAAKILADPAIIVDEEMAQ